MIAVTKHKRQIVILYVSTLLGVLLGLLSSIVNTRFMSTSDYGDVRYIQNVINFIAAFLLFGYFLSGARLMALTDDVQHSRRIKGVMVIILAIACLTLSLIMPVCYFLHADKPTVAILFLVSMPVCAYPLFLNYIDKTTQGDNQIGRLALARILPYLIYVPVGYAVYSCWGATSTRMILLENKRYGIQLYIGSLVMVATNYLAGISLGYFNENNSEVGFYTLALTVTTPLSALPSIVGTAYFKKFATQPCIPTKVIVSTVLMTAFTCICFLLLIHPVVTYFYTDRYAIVGTYASFLSVGFCIQGLGDMFNRYLCSHGQGVSVRNASIANGVFKIFGYTVLVAMFNTNGAIATTIICDVIYFSCLMYYYVRFVKEEKDG